MPINKPEAEALVAASAVGQDLSAHQRERIVNALAVDLRAPSEQGAQLEERLATLEKQMQRLQEAVLVLYRQGPLLERRLKPRK